MILPLDDTSVLTAKSRKWELRVKIFSAVCGCFSQKNSVKAKALIIPFQTVSCTAVNIHQGKLRRIAEPMLPRLFLNTQNLTPILY